MRWVILQTDADGAQHVVGTPFGLSFASEAAAERHLRDAGFEDDMTDWRTMPIETFGGG